MDLRDRFAVHFAAALVDAFPEPAAIARRAYDLADALLQERARRIDAEEAEALVEAHRTVPPALAYHAALLDEPEPDMGWSEEPEPAWLDEPPYDPSWDLEVRWSGAPASRPPGPGLARTQPEEEPAREERLARG